MTDANPTTGLDDLLARFTQGLSTRTLCHVAEEARLDGESLKDAVERYEIDYAWHVLGSQRLLDACIAALGTLLGQPVSVAQRDCVLEILRAAASAQPTDGLMSFDNDVPEHLAALLVVWFASHAEQAVESA